MGTAKQPQLKSRKKPKQSRSSDLVASILEAAIQVLKNEGITRFTTARVAERAGVSVGSLYQYFPNKASILFQLQSDEWEETAVMLKHILAETSLSYRERIQRLVYTFIKSECDEAKIRTALSDAAPLFRDAPEAEGVGGEMQTACSDFICEVLPNSDNEIQTTATSVFRITVSAVGKRFSEEPRTAEEISAFSQHISAMLIAYLDALKLQGQTPEVKAEFTGELRGQTPGNYGDRRQYDCLIKTSVPTKLTK
ncbi:TetR family transcriptional regulator [Vibrio quintilis]|uniref:Division inhibitor protein n=1 Tax=Vibrio quintilis TaxID=1117707 RepID=A0A1M7YYK8_9VIBR|nr:TetR family transcriptional regulator [Vibrio quintilis]SHO57718.1 division inhibitor protein [Vibrio quintilis]